MSLVGTRPPTVDEWDKYELHHRARLATKPGLTGMWQVSGRSNITDFEEVVKLDKQYISEWTIEEFQKREILLDNGQNEHTVDYSIMRVIEIFYSFVKEPVRIDNLIVTHKYICDVWKNGSKHLYFYTLHNQEHAIVLIQNIVKLINTIDFLKISSIDYYIVSEQSMRLLIMLMSWLRKI